MHRGERLRIAVPATPVRSCGQELTRPGARGPRPPGAVNRSCSQRRRRHPDGSRGCHRAWLREPHRSPWGCRRFRGDGRSVARSRRRSPVRWATARNSPGSDMRSRAGLPRWAGRRTARRPRTAPLLHLCRDVHHPVILGSDVPGYRTNPARNRKAGGDDCRATGRNG